jgi:flagellar biosynthesis/type III secretory pathway M-ring protein FliF/YscJ
VIAWLRRAWLWIVAALGSALLVVGLLWRSAARQRDEARRQAEAAAASARRTERLRTDEALADREAEAALVEVEARKEQVDERLGLDRARVEDADLDALAREIEARREAGRMR